MRARGRLDSHRFLAFSWLWVLSVSWVSLVPPAARNAGRWVLSRNTSEPYIVEAVFREEAMDKLAIIFSILTHDYEIMLWFWMIATLPVGVWHIFYFPSKTHISEKELAEISPEFKSINYEYMAFSLLGIGLLMAFPLLVLAPSWDKWSMLKYGIRFYPSILSFTAGYGIYQGLFALLRGVYPMAKSLSYVYDDRAKIRRIAKYQILIAVSSVVFVVLFFFATV